MADLLFSLPKPQRSLLLDEAEGVFCCRSHDGVVASLNEVCSLTKQREKRAQREGAQQMPQRSLLLDEAEGSAD